MRRFIAIKLNSFSETFHILINRNYTNQDENMNDDNSKPSNFKGTQRPRQTTSSDKQIKVINKMRRFIAIKLNSFSETFHILINRNYMNQDENMNYDNSKPSNFKGTQRPRQTTSSDKRVCHSTRIINKLISLLCI